MSLLVVRPREADDLPVLVDLLAEQQATSGYPTRWPLPYPVADFIVRPGEEAAWVAVVDDEVAGHVSVGRPDEVVGAALRDAVGARDVVLVTVLFVAASRRRDGVGRALHDTAVAWIRGTGRTPVLDVVPESVGAVRFYERLGWQRVGTVRPAWVPAGREDLLLMALQP